MNRKGSIKKCVSILLAAAIVANPLMTTTVAYAQSTEKTKTLSTVVVTIHS